MDRYFTATTLDSSKPFAVVVDTPKGIDTIGVSPLGKQWEKWVDELPEKSRKTLEQVIATFGPHVRIDGPNKLTDDIRQEFATMKADATPPAKVAANTR